MQRPFGVTTWVSIFFSFFLFFFCLSFTCYYFLFFFYLSSFYSLISSFSLLSLCFSFFHSVLPTLVCLVIPWRCSLKTICWNPNDVWVILSSFSLFLIFLLFLSLLPPFLSFSYPSYHYLQLQLFEVLHVLVSSHFLLSSFLINLLSSFLFLLLFSPSVSFFFLSSLSDTFLSLLCLSPLTIHSLFLPFLYFLFPFFLSFFLLSSCSCPRIH